VTTKAKRYGKHQKRKEIVTKTIDGKEPEKRLGISKTTDSLCILEEGRDSSPSWRRRIKECQVDQGKREASRHEVIFFLYDGISPMAPLE
jgi:hypothetical protein